MIALAMMGIDPSTVKNNNSNNPPIPAAAGAGAGPGVNG